MPNTTRNSMCPDMRTKHKTAHRTPKVRSCRNNELNRLRNSVRRKDDELKRLRVLVKDLEDQLASKKRNREEEQHATING